MKPLSHSGRKHRGPCGRDGRQGPEGPRGAGVINWRGPWSSDASYAVNDAVVLDGSSFIAITVNHNSSPPSASWHPLSLKGETGVQGQKGDRGERGFQGERGQTGIQGQRGSTGQQGVAGVQGIQGIRGRDGERGYSGPVGMTWKYEWSPDTDYVANDAVSFNGASYIAVKANRLSYPPSAYWNLLAQRGGAGEQGSIGLRGERGEKGEKGDQGIQGIQGQQGIQGERGGFGPDGQQGIQGIPGPQGLRGVNGTGITWRGNWTANSAYQQYDAVEWEGSTYVANSNNTSQPSSDSWDLSAGRGQQGVQGIPGLSAHACDGRLSLVSGDPTPGDVVSDTLFYTPYVSNQVSLFDGDRWNLRTFTELTTSLGGRSDDAPYDVFLFDKSGELNLELVPWQKANVRNVPLIRQDGVLVNSNAPKRRYLGTIQLRDGKCVDRPLQRLVYNNAHKVLRTVGGDSDFDPPTEVVIGVLDTAVVGARNTSLGLNQYQPLIGGYFVVL